MGKPEGRVEKHLRLAFIAAGGHCLKLSASINNGNPDRVGVLGRTVFIETKAPGEGLRRLQRIRCQELVESGAEVFVVDTEEGADALVEFLLTTEPPPPGERGIVYL